MDLKEAAVVNLGRIAAACAGYVEDEGSANGIPETDPFAPFVERTLEVMRRMTVYFHDQIRVKSIGVLRNMVLGSYQVSKAPGPMQAENARRCQQIVQQVLPLLMLRMNKEFNREVAAVSVEAIDAMVNDLGTKGAVDAFGSGGGGSGGGVHPSFLTRLPFFVVLVVLVVLVFHHLFRFRMC